MLALKRLICRLFLTNPTVICSRKTMTTILRNDHMETKYNYGFLTLSKNSLRKSFLKAKIDRLQSISFDSASLLHADRPWSKTCGCCGLNTKGDREFAENVKNEIARKNSSSHLLANLPEVEGFQIAKLNGTSVVLERRTGDESILVKFNINEATLMQEAYEIDVEGQEHLHNQSPMHTSKLPVLIEILKNDRKIIGLRCNINDTEFSDSSSDFDRSEVPLEICELALYDKSDDCNVDVYRISGYLFEEEFQNRLLLVLAERSLDQLFVEHLLEFANSYERLMYVTFLEELKNFLVCNQVT